MLRAEKCLPFLDRNNITICNKDNRLQASARNQVINVITDTQET